MQLLREPQLSARNPLDDAAPGRATEVRCRHCQDRVLLVHADRGEARKAIALHLVKDHDVGDVILEGEDFLCGPAPLRCDLCMAIAEPPFWTYTTPRTSDYPIQDPGWLVCEPCHQVISSQARPLKMLVQRSFSEQMASLILDGVPEAKIRGQLKTTIRGFLDHVEGEPVRE